MAERVGVKVGYLRHFRLDSSKLIRIHEVLQGHAETLGSAVVLEFYVQRGDHSFYLTQDINEVLRDPNSVTKPIRTLVVGLRRPGLIDQGSQLDDGNVANVLGVGGAPFSDRRYVAAVTFTTQWIFRVILYVASGDAERSSGIATQLREQIDRTLVKPFAFTPRWLTGLFVLLKRRRSGFYWGEMVVVHDRLDRRRKNVLWGGVHSVHRVAGSDNCRCVHDALTFPEGLLTVPCDVQGLSHP